MASPLLLHNATLIDGTGADPRAGVSVLVEDGRIARVAPAAALERPMAAIVSATKTNAELFGLADRIGTVEEGKLGDLIAVEEAPLSDIAVLANAERVRLVVKEGEIVKDLDGVR